MIKRLILNLTLILPICVFGQTVTITEEGGWLESVYVKWEVTGSAQKFNVYYSGEGITDQKIDDQLIRKYEDYYRADILGLKAGNYSVKVVPINDGIEGIHVLSSTRVVKSHDRVGFSFSNNRVPGAYKEDGTLKANTVVLYVSETNKNTISLTVTGANSNPCVGLQEILDGFKKGNDSRPLSIRLIGQISDLNYMLNGDIVIENKNLASSYITVEGVGDDAVADGWGIRVKNATNVEIRNIGLMNCNSDEGDNIGLQQNNDYIWVHHCDFFYGDAGGDADQAKGDGALDCKKSTYVTFSYNHFWDSGKSNLLGLSEGTTEGYFITYHHNWFDHSDSRHPRVRYYSAHVYNNYYDGNSKYGVGSTKGSSVFVEANYFRNCRYPILTSMQGTDVYDENTQSNNYSDQPTFSEEDGGTIKAFNNFMTGYQRFVPYGDSGYQNATKDFDAYVADSRDEVVNSSITSAYGGNTYNNFDTNSTVIYSYSPDSPDNAVANVMVYSGRLEGGDFKWSFDNSVDDSSYDVIPELKTALKSYQTSLISIQSDDEEGVYYELNVNVVGDGSVDISSASYLEGSTVTLTATANANWIFDNWSGDVSGDANAVTFTMDSDKEVTANFSEYAGEYYSLSTNATGQGALDPTEGSYPEGSIVSITATPSSGWLFVEWTGDITGASNPINLTFNTDKSVGAVFEEAFNGGRDRIEDDDSRLISFDGSLKSYPNADNGNAINLSNSVGKRIVWEYEADKSIPYQITLRYTRKQTMSSRGKLIVNGSSEEISFATTQSGDFATTTLVFNLTTGTNTIVFETIDDGESADIDWIELVSNEPDPVMYTLTTSVIGEGSVTPSEGVYEEGTEIQISAIPETNYLFEGWSGDLTSDSTNISLTMDSDKTLLASFVKEEEVEEEEEEETILMTERNEVFEIFPNPVLSVLTVSIRNHNSESSSLSILDLSGRLIRQFYLQERSEMVSLDVSHLDPSFYILMVQQDDFMQTKRFIKK
jgi:pectate lyase